MVGDGGVVAAALTPRDKRGELNFSACFDLLDHLSKAQVRGIALLTDAGPLSRAPLDSLMATGRFAGIAGEHLNLSVEACAVPELYVALDCAPLRGDQVRIAALQACAAEFERWANCFSPLVAVKAATA